MTGKSGVNRLGWIAAILCAGSIVILVESCSSTSADAPSRRNAIDPGQQVFRTHCVLCHGARGNLQLNGAKVLGESILTLEERVEVITNGRNVMTPFGKILSPEQIEQVARYTFSFSDTTHVE